MTLLRSNYISLTVILALIYFSSDRLLCSASLHQFTKFTNIQLNSSRENVVRDAHVFIYGQEKVRGVNLGGWLLLEPWITPSLFEQFVGAPQEAVDEYTFTQVLGYREAKRQLHKHWSTWVIEKDIATLASYGINHIRIPIGYWAFDKKPTEPFVVGAFEYLLKAVIWAKKYNLKVVLDLHGAPGSQNGFDNSGRRDSVGWQTSAADNIPRTIKVVKIMTERFNTPEFKNTVTAINVLNEPSNWGGNQLNITQKFYKDSYNVVRHMNNDILVVFHTAFLPLKTWHNFLSSSGFDRIVLDTHNYAVFEYSLLALNQEQRLKNFTCSNKADIISNQGIWFSWRMVKLFKNIKIF
ncbi:putative Glucan 1,3-beta-glucosidase [Gigaspora margarita]|uniref:glucan 1,3-beta-glucosidase n=1 Tax=Gigaspora margarita TaxID=4874 RepID=A0A8H4ETP6_GIGMA|nr:putative Glucan 1,3-beta-glucosidase [Gigaspora margarita]